MCTHSAACTRMVAAAGAVHSRSIRSLERAGLVSGSSPPQEEKRVALLPFPSGGGDGGELGGERGHALEEQRAVEGAHSPPSSLLDSPFSTLPNQGMVGHQGMAGSHSRGGTHHHTWYCATASHLASHQHLMRPQAAPITMPLFRPLPMPMFGSCACDASCFSCLRNSATSL